VHSFHRGAFSIHYNGDYSGDVILVGPNPDDIEASRQAGPGDMRQATFIKLEIPFEVIKDFVAAYVRMTKVEKLRDSSTDEVLGLGA
jgi:hypothetical protein